GRGRPARSDCAGTGRGPHQRLRRRAARRTHRPLLHPRLVRHHRRARRPRRPRRRLRGVAAPVGTFRAPPSLPLAFTLTALPMQTAPPSSRSSRRGAPAPLRALRWLGVAALTVFGLAALVGSGGGGGGDPEPVPTPPPTGGPVTISGTADFASVPNDTTVD